jgi:hypothetical protein
MVERRPGMQQKVFRLPKDIPMEEYPQPQVYLDEARRLSAEGQKQGVILRVMGPIALHFYFPEYVDLYRRMERLGERVFTDIDFASYGKCRGKIVHFFQANEYEIEKRAAMISGNTRHIYFGGKVPMIDVFFDKLSYNHPVDYKNRLEIHPYCVSLTDLLLQKLQIVEINDKDLKDGMLLLLAAEMGETDQGVINTRYLGKIMSDDWGFYYTATTNLGKVKQHMQGVAVLTDEHRKIIAAKADALLDAIEKVPKSGNWKRRAQLGTKKPWYNEVSDWA